MAVRTYLRIDAEVLMPHRVVLTCISPAVKKILQAEAHHVTDSKTRQTFEALLKETPDCRNGAVVGLETDDGQTKPRRAKRPPSEYNLFIGQCIRERPKDQPVPQAMKGCALKWRQRRT